MEAIFRVERVQVLPAAFVTVRVEREASRGNAVRWTRATVGVEMDGLDMARHWISRRDAAGMGGLPADARIWARSRAGRETLRARTAYGAEIAYRAATGRPLGGPGMAYSVRREAAGMVIGLDVWRAWCARSPERHAEPRAVCEAWAREGDTELARRLAYGATLEGAQWQERIAEAWLRHNAGRLVRMAADAVLG